MRLDASVARTLHIFHADSHPSLMGIGSSKEGFSLFAMMDHTVSAPGRRALRRWFSRPLACLSALNKRQDALAFFVERQDERSQLRTLLKQVCVAHATRVQNVFNTIHFDAHFFAFHIIKVSAVWGYVTDRLAKVYSLVTQPTCLLC